MHILCICHALYCTHVDDTLRDALARCTYLAHAGAAQAAFLDEAGVLRRLVGEITR